MKTISALAVLFSCLFSSSSVLAWGKQPHKIICGIALEFLSDDGMALLEEVRNLESFVVDTEDATTPSFQSSCLWPDNSKKDTHKGTYEYHYINVEKEMGSFKFTRDCAPLDCNIVGIQRYVMYLAGHPVGKRQKERKAHALRYLGHFVGDLHQPLHVGHVEDFGGNKIKVSWFGEDFNMNLHKVWDSQITTRGGITTQEDARNLAEEITEENIQEWSTFDITGWAGESYRLAKEVAYSHPNGDEVIQGEDLREEYFDAALPIAIERIKMAGVRLAFLINSAADGTLPLNMLIPEELGRLQ